MAEVLPKKERLPWVYEFLTLHYDKRRGTSVFLEPPGIVNGAFTQNFSNGKLTTG